MAQCSFLIFFFSNSACKHVKIMRFLQVEFKIQLQEAHITLVK